MRPRRDHLLLPAVFLVLSAVPIEGAVVPLGEPIDVVDQGPLAFESRPRTCSDPSGAFIVAWTEVSTFFNARRFSRDGRPLTEPFSLLQNGGDLFFSPKIACKPSGGFLLVWRHPTEVYGESEIRARTFSATGWPSSPTVRVDEAGYWNTRFDAACGGSGCVVTWTRKALDTEFESILVRHLDPDGVPLGHELLLDSSSYDDAYPAVALGTDGSHAIAWSWSVGGVVRAQRFSPDGQTMGPQISLRSADGDAYRLAGTTVAWNGEDELLVAWIDNDGTTQTGPAVYSVVSPDGSFLVDQARLDPGTIGAEAYFPRAFADAGGGFVVAWGDAREDRIMVRQLTPTGAPRGPSQILVEETLLFHAEANFDLAPRFDGSFVLAWEAWPSSAGIDNRVSLFQGLHPAPPRGDWLASPAVPSFGFKVRISTPSGSIVGTREPSCIPETVCVSGALPGRSEVFLRVVGPKPNGSLWPTLVKFSTSQVEVWVRQQATGSVRYYVLEGARPGLDELPGLFDRVGFLPGGSAGGAGAVLDGLTFAEPMELAGAGGVPPPSVGAVFTSPHFPGFRFRVRISTGAQAQEVRQEAACIEETLCLSAAVPGRSEVFLRIVGPKPNGRLWPTIVKFTTSSLEVWVERISNGETKYYRIPGAAPGKDDLTGLFDREGFMP